MEILQSTEILDREILDDARKKAERILKSADDTVRVQSAEWESKTQANLDELYTKQKEQTKTARDEIMARLPIDKQRIKIEKIEALLNSAVDFWYNSLSRAQVLDLLSSELSKRLSAVKEILSIKSESTAAVSGLDAGEAKDILKRADISCNIEEVHSLSRYPSITLETENVRIISSIQNIIDYLLEKKRAELVEALVSRDFLEKT